MEKNQPDYPPGEWRLILSDPLSGAMNMALDSAILAAVENGQSPPTLRLYRWDPACLSLGYSQSYSDVDQDLLDSHGYDIIRRPTGGRAILHTDELTYAVIGPRSDPRLEGGLLDSYQRLSIALQQALLNLGLPVEVHQGKNRLAHHHPVCFENPSDYEITVRGKKIIGSAQARKKTALLQHGSLPLRGDLTRITRVLSYPSPQEREQAAQALIQKATTASEVLGQEVSWEQAARAFRQAFSTVLHLSLIEGEISPREESLFTELLRTQYASPDWTQGSKI